MPMQGSLNAFMALGRPAWRQVRSALQSLLTDAAGMLADPTVQQRAVVPMVRRISLLQAMPSIMSRFDAEVKIETLEYHAETCSDASCAPGSRAFNALLQVTGRSGDAAAGNHRRLHGLLRLQRACHQRGLHVPGRKERAEPQLVCP